MEFLYTLLITLEPPFLLNLDKSVPIVVCTSNLSCYNQSVFWKAQNLNDVVIKKDISICNFHKSNFLNWLKYVNGLGEEPLQSYFFMKFEFSMQCPWNKIFTVYYYFLNKKGSVYKMLAWFKALPFKNHVNPKFDLHFSINWFPQTEVVFSVVLSYFL